MANLDFKVTPRQKAFLTADANEILYGGAAGGGKSFGQFIDTVLYAGKYVGSKQLLLRRTFNELERSIIRIFENNLPRSLFKYNQSKHTGKFLNGSLVDFGYIDNERDLKQYQSSEYDVIRFDELTHFTEEMYVYMLSRLRGTAPFPRFMKSSTNPGGVGHTWVKARFIDPMQPNVVQEFFDKDGDSLGTRVFIPARVQDNTFLMRNDPGYLRNLKNLSDRDQRALLYGEWDLFDGQYFDNFNRDVHIIDPIFERGKPPADWQFYVSIDYGLDMLAALLVGVAPGNRYYVVDEFYDGNQHPDKEHTHKGLIVSEAAAKIKELCKGYTVRRIFAPPDLWGRSKDTGKSVQEVFRENGVPLWRVDNNRVAGWMVLKERLQVHEDEQGGLTADLKIFSCCRNLIRTLPALGVDPHNPNDAATEPHELTHAPDALRYFFAGRPQEKRKPAPSAPHYDFEALKPPKPIAGKGEKMRVL